MAREEKKRAGKRRVAREEKKRARRCDRKNEDEGDWNWFEELCVANSDTFRIVFPSLGWVVQILPGG